MKKKKQRVLTIDRSKWQRGAQPEPVARLLSNSGFMCCLGFDAVACGVRPETIRGIYRPDDLNDFEIPDDYAQTRGHVRGQRHPVDRAIAANDSTTISERQREMRVRKALIALGWDDVVFVDGVKA